MLASRLSVRATKSINIGLRSFNSIGIRNLSTNVEPKEKATSIIDSLPGNSILSKTGILATTFAASVYAISSELYVVNDETILLVTFMGFVGLISKVVAPMYGEMAKDRTLFVTKLLNDARANHVNAVKDRISEVSNLKDIVATTKALFEISKETAALEAESFQLKQSVDVASEAKNVLESWVRYENQVKQLEQEQLSSSVISKVKSELHDSKFQEKILSQAVGDVEKLFAKK